MTEERNPMPAKESTAAATAAKQRKKRKWDQPAESLISAGFSVPATLPLGTSGIVGISLPGTIPLPSAVITNPVLANSATASLLFQSSTVSQNPATLVQKFTQPKIQDELIAREIVINDAEPTVRYKLTKRQTQEEVQRSTGAVVITRGKYRSPDALSDNEKPLYLHVSAGAHLKDTAERIKAVDHAALMIEDILKQGQGTLPAAALLLSAISNGQATQLLSTCLFLGFETDPLLNIAARIRGPNDQYINHIMNETGATVILRGRSSGNIENVCMEEAQQPLHLYLSSANPKSLEAARILAENLLDTISAECGASRISSCKVYSAVPPLPHLLSGVQSSGETLGASANPVPVGSTPLTPCPGPNGSTLPSGCAPNFVNLQPHVVRYPYPLVTGGTSYSGYGGIYPQATPLQQVALALKQAPAAATPALASTASAVIMSSKSYSSSTADTEKQPPHKRKFQELLVASKETRKHHQGPECLKPGFRDSVVRNSSTMPPPKKLVRMESDAMPPPPPPQIMSLPASKFAVSKSPLAPPPPKFVSLQAEKSQDHVMKKPYDEPVSGDDPKIYLNCSSRISHTFACIAGYHLLFLKSVHLPSSLADIFCFLQRAIFIPRIPLIYRCFVDAEKRTIL